MHKDLTEFLTLDVTDLLENPAFRAWAMSPEFTYPSEYPKLGEARDILLAIVDAETKAPSVAERSADFAALMARLEEPTPVVAKVVTRRLWPRWAAVAASILVLLWAGSFFLRKAPHQEYVTGNGEILEVELPDGTSVTLNANSSLVLPAGGWSAAERLVNLEGEAFFKVTKQLAQGEPRPFMVQTEDAVVRVLGTRFNVRQRRGGIRVFLEEGAVKVGWPGSQFNDTNLLPGEMVDYEEASAAPVHRPAFAPQNEIAWTQGHLVFDRVPLREALNDLSDLYGVSFELADPELENKELKSAGIPVDNQEVALGILGRALDLQIEVRKDNVYLVSVKQ